MPVFVLYVRLEGENLGGLEWPRDKHWTLDVQQAAGTEVRTEVTLSNSEEHEVANSRATANFVMKWSKSDKSQCTANVQEIKDVTTFLNQDNIGDWVPVVAFECRGLEPIKWHPDGGFTVISSGGAKLEDADLSEEWADYDEKNDLSVSIMAVEHKFELYKKK